MQMNPQQSTRYRVVVALLVSLASVYLGWAVAMGSWRPFIALGVIVGTALALRLGPRLVGMAVLCLAALPLYSQSYRIPLLWFVVVLWLLSSVAEKVLGARSGSGTLGVPERLLPVLFLVFGVLSNLVGTETVVQDVASKTLALVAGVGVYYLTAWTFSDRTWHSRAALALAIGGVGVLAIGLLQMTVPSLRLPGMFSSSVGHATGELGRTTVRFAGPLGDYELMAEMLGLSALILLTSASREIRSKRALLYLLGGAAVAGVFMTGTRGGVVVLLFGGALIMLKHRSIASNRALPLGIALAAGIASGVGNVLPDTGATLERVTEIQFGSGLATALNRASVWPLFINRILATSSIATGHGLEFDLRGIGTYPHSLYLYLLYTQGVVGLGLFVGLLARLIAPIARILREPESWDSTSLAPILVLIFAVDEVKIEFMRLYGYQMWVWALLGLAASGVALRRRERALEAEVE